MGPIPRASTREAWLRSPRISEASCWTRPSTSRLTFRRSSPVRSICLRSLPICSSRKSTCRCRMSIFTSARAPATQSCHGCGDAFPVMVAVPAAPVLLTCPGLPQPAPAARPDLAVPVLHRTPGQCDALRGGQHGSEDRSPHSHPTNHVGLGHARFCSLADCFDHDDARAGNHRHSVAYMQVENSLIEGGARRTIATAAPRPLTALRNSRMTPSARSGRSPGCPARRAPPPSAPFSPHRAGGALR